MYLVKMQVFNTITTSKPFFQVKLGKLYMKPNKNIKITENQERKNKTK
jgi:hypothetical protein